MYMYVFQVILKAFVCLGLFLLTLQKTQKSITRLIDKIIVRLPDCQNNR